jgi:hypothetical protein
VLVNRASHPLSHEWRREVNIRWIAIGCMMQGASTAPILQHYGYSNGIDFNTAVALLSIGLIVEIWPGKRWALRRDWI